MTDGDPSRPQSAAPPVRLGRYHARWHQALRLVAQRLVLRPVVLAVTTTRVEGIDNVGGLTGPYVLVANHCSHLDTAVLVSRLPYRLTRKLTVGAAADYFYTHWWKKAATSVFFNTYPIQRSGDGGSGKGLSQGLLEGGLPILLFPEGTRSRDGVMADFKPGAALLSATSGAPCVPVAIIGTHEAMPVGRSWPVRGRPPVRVLVGGPMRARPGEQAEEFNERIAGRIRAMRTRQTPYVLDDPRPDGDEREGRSEEEAS